MTLKPARLLPNLLLTLLVSATVFSMVPVAAENVVAVVNGTAIPASRLNDMVKQVTSQPNAPKDSPELREKIKDELINREIFLQAANKLGLAKSVDVKTQLEMARQSILIRALITEFVKKNPISEAEIKAEYDRIVAQAGDKEYHVRHILVGTEEEAKSIIAKLKAGSNFGDLAKAESKDTGSANNGGDLDWATPAAFVKPFSDAMVNLEKGQLTETPVKTQFGYHVVQVDDIRPVTIPQIDAVRKQIIEGLEQRKLLAYQEELRKNATIK